MVKDTEVNDHNGTFTDWRLTLWGECIDPSKQELLPMPTESDDDDHDVISATPSYISIGPGVSQTELPANPTDHQHRPVNAKPTAAKAAQTSAMTSATPTISSVPDVPPEEEDVKDAHFLPHYFPAFGVSKRTQIWIYGAVGIILLFCAGLGTYYLVQRRKRRRSEREDYEFEMLDEDEGMLNGGAGADGKKGRRAGELYDAFAGESDEEQLLSESEAEEEYRDDGPDEIGRGRGKEREGSSG